MKDQALADVQKQPWDPSVQALAGFPDLVKRLADDIQWTTDLGNAVLAQEGDVMDAVQRMRKKAQDAGKLTSTEQQKVETKVVESKTVVVIQQANPQVVYVPTYNPVVVWGPPIYPYPPIYYPPPGYYATGLAISFGVGVEITSPSTTIILSSGTRTPATATAATSTPVMVTTGGSTGPNTEAAPLTATAPLQTGLAAQPVVIASEPPGQCSAKGRTPRR